MANVDGPIASDDTLDYEHDPQGEGFPSPEECRTAIMIWKREVIRLNPLGLGDLKGDQA